MQLPHTLPACAGHLQGGAPSTTRSCPWSERSMPFCQTQSYNSLSEDQHWLIKLWEVASRRKDLTTCIQLQEEPGSGPPILPQRPEDLQAVHCRILSEEVASDAIPVRMPRGDRRRDWRSRKDCRTEPWRPPQTASRP